LVVVCAVPVFPATVTPEIRAADPVPPGTVLTTLIIIWVTAAATWGSWLSSTAKD